MLQEPVGTQTQHTVLPGVAEERGTVGIGQLQRMSPICCPCMGGKCQAGMCQGVTQHLALLKQAGSLKRHKWRSVMHFSTCQCRCWGPAGKLHVLKTKFCFCCFSEHSKADVLSATPKLSSWDNYL